jgi:tRNA G18 (ribose-2'-O)-methylase SpoU
MPRIAITHLEHPGVTIYRSLKATNQTRSLGQFVVEGEKLLERLITSRFPMVSALVTERYLPRLEAMLPASVPVYVVADSMIDSIVGFPFHRGVLACGQRLPWPELDQLVDRSGSRSTLVVCPRISNPENLGAIARIADMFDVAAVLAGPSCPDALSRRVLRVSMGSSLRVPVIVSDRLGEIVDDLKVRARFEFLGAVADPAAEPFDAFARPDRLGVILGEEDQGIEPAWLSRCTRQVTIPMRPGAGSLNVAVAAGILIHGLTRR